MSASLPIIPDDDLTRVAPSAAPDADPAGFGALLTGAGACRLSRWT